MYPEGKQKGKEQRTRGLFIFGQEKIKMCMKL